jgi:hypothetical protein
VEEEIFLEIMSKLVKIGMWEAIKQDGRLAYRGGPGIHAHVAAIVRPIYIPTSFLECSQLDQVADDR